MGTVADNHNVVVGCADSRIVVDDCTYIQVVVCTVLVRSLILCVMGQYRFVVVVAVDADD